MVRHLSFITTLAETHKASLAAVHQCGSRLGRVRLEATVVSPYISPEDCTHRLFGNSHGVVLSGSFAIGGRVIYKVAG